jgi:hypothetical protein
MAVFMTRISEERLVDEQVSDKIRVAAAEIDKISPDRYRPHPAAAGPTVTPQAT